MKLSRIAVSFAVASLLSLPAAAGDSKPTAPKPPRMDQQTRLNLIRGLNAETIFIRRTFPMGETGLVIKNGIVSPNDDQVRQISAAYGPSVKPGDRAQITNVIFKGNKLIFEINGGPKKKTRWYDHISVSMGGSPDMSTAQQDPRANPRGTFAALVFDEYVPQLTVNQVKKMLEPVFDFNSLSAAEAFVQTVSPQIRDAIKNHKVLVGMDREMVNYSKGRPPRKIRETADGKDYEEWIYGQPPQEVDFIRFVGDEVVRVETIQVDGQKVVRTAKEVDVKKPQPAIAETIKPGDSPRPKNAPTLRRDGEEIGQQNTTGSIPPRSQTGQQIPGAPRPNDPNNPGIGGPPMGQPPMGGPMGGPQQIPGGVPGQQPPCCSF